MVFGGGPGRLRRPEVNARRVGAHSVGAEGEHPKGAGPKDGEPNFSLFFPLSEKGRGVFSWNCGRGSPWTTQMVCLGFSGVILCARPPWFHLMTPKSPICTHGHEQRPHFHEKTLQEREKSENGSGRRKKKNENFGRSTQLCELPIDPATFHRD